MPFGITISEDEIGAVSSDMYKEFFEKELHEFSERYGQIGIHCCANAKHQWGNLKNVPNLRLINIGKNEPQAYESIEFFRNVCAQHPMVYGDPIEFGRFNNPGEIHAVQQVIVRTKEEAIDAVRKFNEGF
jgi:methionine synthase II (cobalamin-independent)